MANKNYAEVEILVNDSVSSRKVAFAKGINRDVNLANAKKIAADIKANGYRQAELIQVIPADEVIAAGDLSLVDINKDPIEDTEAFRYYLVLDGQHRIYAASLYNKENPGNKIQVPAVEVDLSNGETVSQYIAAINITKVIWNSSDYVRGAANVQSTDLLVHYKELIKSEDNPNGFPLSTLNLIFCLNAKALNKLDLSLLCEGKLEKGSKQKKKILPAYNLDRGNRFIEICKGKGFSQKDLAKRYLIQQFIDITTAESEERAFQIFDAVTENDRKAMYNEKKNLTEDLVRKQFEIILNRTAK
ncbi:MAG: hypothetical protein HDR88_14555 [Bacteroides sp.]|nr:hypothetical protein [Bacteroides sp.]